MLIFDNKKAKLKRTPQRKRGCIGCIIFVSLTLSMVLESVNRALNQLKGALQSIEEILEIVLKIKSLF